MNIFINLNFSENNFYIFSILGIHHLQQIIFCRNSDAVTYAFNAAAARSLRPNLHKLISPQPALQQLPSMSEI
jgi:hypothetical protein